MASSSWQKLGDGFSPDNCSSRKLLYQGGQKTKLRWNQSTLFSDFSTTDQKPREHDFISWSASSSEEENDLKPDGRILKSCNERRKRPYKQNNSGIKKRSTSTNTTILSPTKKLNCSSTCASEFTKISHDAKKSVSLASTSSNSKIWSKCDGKQKSGNISGSWNISNFDDMKQCELPRSCLKNNRNNSKGCISVPEKHEEVSISESDFSSENEEEEKKKESDVCDVSSDESASPQRISRRILQSKDAILSKDEENEYAEINSANSPIVDGPGSHKLGASDWAMQFQREVSPDLVDGDGEKNSYLADHPDSTKKKQKFSSNSLACQLSRLINREKSSVRFWQHSLSKGPSEETSQKAVTVKVLSMCRQYSFYIAECLVVDDSSSLLISKTCKVMFTKNFVEQMKVQPTMMLQLFPPWKQLDEGEITTLLCANHIKILPNEEEPSENLQIASVMDDVKRDDATAGCHDNHANKSKALHHQVLDWACPCKQKTLPSDKCPARQSDHWINFLSKMALLDKSSQSLRPIHISSVECSRALFLDHAPSPAVEESLMESIHVERSGAECMPPFMATVLRVFHQKNPTQNTFSLSVLMEDNSSTLAMVQLVEMNASSYKSLWCNFYCNEGKLCICQDLTMVSRRNIERDSSLFQVISRVWKNAKPQAQSQDTTQVTAITRKVPSFCYTLQPVGERQDWLTAADTQDGRAVDCLELRTCRDAVKDGLYQRISCVAFVLDLRHCFCGSSGTLGLFVCDTNDDQEQTMATTIYHLSMNSKCIPLENLNDRKMHLCLLQDVYFSGDIIQADEFSTLVSLSALEKLKISKPVDERLFENLPSKKRIFVPSLGQCKESEVFVKVSGRIADVDTDKCYSVEACPECHTELTSDDAGSPSCPTCKSSVSQPCTLINMEVELREETSETCPVKINLTQSTIKSLLPLEVPSDGFDMEQVLGKSIRGIAYVHSRQNGVVQLYQVDVSENLC